MLLSKSPVRSISEKLKSPQASIKDMKIERKKDFRSFLKYIERESKELEKIKLPSRNEVTKKSGSGGIGALLGFGALGLLGLLGGMGDKGNMYKYGDKNLGGNIFRGPYAVGRDEKGGDDDQKIDEGNFVPPRTFFNTQYGAANAATLTKQLELDLNKQQQNLGKKTVNRKREIEYQSSESVVNEKKRGKSKPVEETVSFNQNQQNTTTVDDIRKAKGTYQRRISRFFDRDGSKKGDSGARKPPVQNIEDPSSSYDFKKLSIDEQIEFQKIKKEVADEASSFFDAESDFFKDQQSQRGLFDTRKFKGFKNFKRMNFARFITGTKIRRSFRNDFKKPTLGINTMEDMFSKLRLGKKTDLFKANPKGMNMFKLGTFSKGKTGFMIADFGLAAYDLYSSLRKVTPRSNIGASLLDLVGINLNNFVADMINNPSMLREYVSVTNDPNAINVNKNREIINENIRKIKEQNKKNFTGADITEGSITGKQIRENLNPFKNPQTYNPFSTYQVKPNPDLFSKPSGDPNDDVLGMFQSAAMEAN